MSIKPVRSNKMPSSDDHVLRVALRVLTFPWTVLRAAFRGVCRLLGSCKSEDQVRDADQVRQSRARRTLRGLTPDHDADSNRPLDATSGHDASTPPVAR